MNLDDWHARFVQQAGWTAEARSLIRREINLSEKSRILEIGSGTGAVLDSFYGKESGLFVGLDIHLPSLRFHQKSQPSFELLNADGYKIPFAKNSFELVYCHYLLLWLQQPINLLREMKRITRRGGWVACFAEPDYNSRIDFPETYSQIGLQQNQSLSKQGINLSIGRQLAQNMRRAGFSNATWGIIGAHHNPDQIAEHNQLEELVLADDLQKLASEEKKSHPGSPYQRDMENEDRIQFIPTFYAYAQNE